MDNTEHDSPILKLALIELLIQEKTVPDVILSPKPMISGNSRNKAKENDNPDDIDEKLKAINDIANQSKIISLP